MKQINILKKAAGVISILLILLSLTACGNAISENNEDKVVEPVETTTNGITFKGQIKLHGAASARSATSSFDGNYTWHIIAQNEDLTEANPNPTQEILEQAYRSTVSTTDEFTLTLPVAGNWILVIYGYAGTYTESTLPVYTSAIFVYADNNFTISEENADKQFTFYATVNASALAYGSDEGSLSGSLSLPITCNAETVYQVSAKLKNNLDPDAEPVAIAPKAFSNGASSLVASNIPAGIYTARIYFEDAQGNTMYSCTEAITIYPGLTTDTWFGTAPYLNNGAFTLTENLIEKYGTEIVPNTQLVLYEYYTNNTDSGYKYYLADSADTSPTTADLTNNYPGQSNFCFDKNGNLYALMKNDSELYLMSTKNGFVSSDTGRSFGSTLFMAIDREMDTLWLLADQELSLYGFKKISEQSSLPDNQSDLRSAYVSSNYFYDPEDVNYSPTAIAAGNGFLYLAKIKQYATNNGGSWKLLVTKTDVVSDVVDNGSNKELHCYNTKAADFSDFNFTSNATINDMLYQNGAVYILISENDVDLSMNPSDPDNHPEISDILKGNIINRGTVVKYDTITGAFSYITSEKEYVSLEKLHVLGRQSGGSDYRLYLDTDKTPFMYNMSDHSGAYANVYACLSSDLSAKVLHSPKKFIAIKPKKLVIADDGVAYYIDSAGGLRYKNENRVVEIDLESFAISKAEPASVAFGEDESEDKAFSFTINSIVSSETTFYGGDPIGELSEIGNYFLGILSEDN